MEKQKKWLLRLVILLLVMIILYVFLKLGPLWQPIFKVIFKISIPFIISIFITYLLHPVVEYTHNRGMSRPIAILLIYLLFFGGIGLIGYKGIPVIIDQLWELSDNFPRLAQTYSSWIKQIHHSTSNWPDGMHHRVEQSFNEFETMLSNLMTKVVAGLKGILNSFFILIVIPFIVFYLLKDFDQVKKTMWYLTPRKWREPGMAFLKDVDISLGSYIRGQLTVCLLIGILATASLWISGMKYPMVLGAIIGVTNVIPYFGPIIGAFPAVIIAATISVKMVIIVIVIIFSLQFIEGNILSPLIVGKSLHIHPVFIILALLIGGEVAGVVGLILAVPVFAVLKVTLTHVSAHFIKH
ncbi:AI-2E family transporter [Sutcliffiella rhizosphaerae]|uniref:Transport protein n=1 Tax=Sutcliffiella rhizosphaerae TaxID=2880967 RepID=A0ABN8A446_9BACI|nr:AI-2E family transporter [Sutcliffiella rhizosphaerae]CAG9619429.1 Putative transport protein [Sutcliffiella rhizosphaerae]